ncbi:MAG TPA: dolichyl-phosphate beta-glucosyltransferase [Planctomycetota bacterium]|nr:dolichyl-phosphate beta-glucosyltransferase [Planctomycetota bacterium]
MAETEPEIKPEHPASGIRKQVGPVLAGGKTLSVVIPAYNESKRIGQTFREIRAWLDEHFARRYEVLVVDDGSRDNTPALVEEEAKKWPELKLLRQPLNLGKGAAVRRGCLEAKNDYVLFMDADHATPIEELRGFFPRLEQGFDIVVGVRTFQESESRSRRIMGLGLLMLAHLIVFSKAVVDSQCGFKLFKRDICQKIFSRCRIDGGMIDVEVFHIAHHLNTRIWFAPVYWDNKEGSTINIWRCIIFDPFDLVGIRWRGMRHVYEKPISRQPWELSTN